MFVVRLPDVVLLTGIGIDPASDPVAEAAELGMPPALAEPSEYMEDTDMRFASDSEGAFRAGSGSSVCFWSSAIVLKDSFGVSVLSIAKSSLLDLPVFKLEPCLPASDNPVPF